jgi:hypothetical protein
LAADFAQVGRARAAPGLTWVTIGERGVDAFGARDPLPSKCTLDDGLVLLGHGFHWIK